MNKKTSSSLLSSKGNISIAISDVKLKKLAKNGKPIIFPTNNLPGLHKREWSFDVLKTYRKDIYLDDSALCLLFIYTAHMIKKPLNNFLFLEPIQFSLYFDSLKLGQRGADTVESFLFSYLRLCFSEDTDTILLPYVLRYHWFLIVASKSESGWTFRDYDSLRGHISTKEKKVVINALAYAINLIEKIKGGAIWADLVKACSQEEFNNFSVPTDSIKSVMSPAQEGGYECGWYVWLVGQTILRGKYKKFSSGYFKDARQKFLEWLINTAYTEK